MPTTMPPAADDRKCCMLPHTSSSKRSARVAAKHEVPATGLSGSHAELVAVRGDGSTSSRWASSFKFGEGGQPIGGIVDTTDRLQRRAAEAIGKIASPDGELAEQARQRLAQPAK